MISLNTVREKISVKYIGFLFLSLAVAIVIFVPRVHYKIGHVFFGGVSKLYNVRLAEFFFTLATEPLVGKPPPFAYHQLSRTHFIQGELDISLAEAYREIEHYPDHYNTYYIIGLTLGYMDREEEAIEAFGRFIEHKPESWAARNDRAWLQFRIGDIDGALETLAPILEAQTYNPWVQNTYGTLLLNKRNFTEAREAFLRARESASKMDETVWGRAYPGNDPRVYGRGLAEMRTSIEDNLRIIDILQP